MTLCFLGTALLAGDPASAISGGRPATVEEQPSVVAIGAWPYPRPSHQFCAGTLVAPDKVVTVAHCFPWYVPRGLVKVTGGRTDLGGRDGSSVGVADVWVHPGLASHGLGDDDYIYDNDIAVVTLSSPLPYRPSAYATTQDRDLYRPGTDGQILGWGDLSEQGPASEVLRKATVPLVSDRDCAQAYGSAFNPATMVCAGYSKGGVDACQYDSGGPLVIAGKLVGLVSGGKGCARPGKPGVYTRVASFADDLSRTARGAPRRSSGHGKNRQRARREHQ